MVRFKRCAARRSRLIRRACSACVPWEKFRRATSMPRRIRSRIVSSESQAGPMVQIIFARRMRSAASSGTGAEAGSFPSTRSSLLSFKSASSGVYPWRRNFRETTWEKHGVEFGANQHNQRDDVHPEQQRNAHTERTIDDAVVDIVLQIPSKQRSGDQPHRGGKNSAWQNAVPRLRARHCVVINKLDHGNAGHDRDGPADRAPQQQNQRSELMTDVKQNTRFNPASESNQNGREGHRYARHQNQRNRNRALLNQPPGFGKLVGTTKAIHPG